jgi:hypothetical protein
VPYLRFGTAGKGRGKLIYNDTALILALAIADGALFGYSALQKSAEIAGFA